MPTKCKMMGEMPMQLDLLIFSFIIGRKQFPLKHCLTCICRFMETCDRKGYSLTTFG